MHEILLAIKEVLVEDGFTVAVSASLYGQPHLELDQFMIELADDKVIVAQINVVLCRPDRLGFEGGARVFNLSDPNLFKAISDYIKNYKVDDIHIDGHISSERLAISRNIIMGNRRR